MGFVSHFSTNYRQLEILLLVFVFIANHSSARSISKEYAPHESTESFYPDVLYDSGPEWLVPEAKRSHYFGRRHRDLLMPAGGTLMELIPNGGQDLAQLQRAIRVWEAKLMRFAEKFADHPDALHNNPIWQKLMKIRGTLAQLIDAEERVTGLDETRM